MTLAENIIREFNYSEKKSFSKQEVVRIIKNCTSSHHRPDLESNGVLISPEKDLIFVNGKEKRVPQRVFNLLYYFIENKNKVVERGSLLRDVWGTDIVVSHRTIDVHVCKIRNLDIPFIKTLKHAYIWQE
jgi:DNA-binding response OmpR family regulator